MDVDQFGSSVDLAVPAITERYDIDRMDSSIECNSVRESLTVPVRRRNSIVGIRRSSAAIFAELCTLLLVGVLVALAGIRPEVAMSTEMTVDGLRVISTNHSVAEILSRVDSLSRAKGLTVFARFDFSTDAARSGLTLRPTGLVILGNPKSGTPLIVATPTVAIDLPLKVLAWQDADGRTWVAYNEPEYLQKRHHFPTDLVKNVAALGALVAAAAGGDP